MSTYGYDLHLSLNSTLSKFIDWAAKQEGLDEAEYLKMILRDKIEEECDEKYNEFYRSTDGY